MEKIHLIMGFMAVCIVAGFAVSIRDFNNSKKEAEKVAFVSGANYGAEKVVEKIVVNSLDCKQTPIGIGNETIHMIPIECIRQKASSNE